jgi:hypothetical protein
MHIAWFVETTTWSTSQHLLTAQSELALQWQARDMAAMSGELN